MRIDPDWMCNLLRTRLVGKFVVEYDEDWEVISVEDRKFSVTVGLDGTIWINHNDDDPICHEYIDLIYQVSALVKVYEQEYHTSKN